MELPDFITSHIDPLSGDDNTYDMDAGSGLILSTLPPLQSPLPELPRDALVGTVAEPESRNALCPCGSGRKYKHCHGALV